MPKRATSRSQDGLAVLHVTHEVAEWLAPGEPCASAYSRADVLGSAPGDLVAAAALARGSVHKRQRCLLVLGGKLVESRILGLPPMPCSDLPAVLARKAAGLLNVEQRDALYAALALASDPDASTDEPGEQRWRLLAVRRSLLQPLVTGLQRSRIDVDRVVSGPMARLCEAQALRGDTAAPCVVIDVDLDAVVVSLIQSDGLHLQNRIPGAFERTPSMALTLVQELRTFDAYWRKASRGAGVTQVLVIGLDPERSKLFANAVSAALAGARVTLCPAEGDLAEPGGTASTLHRRTALAAVRSTGPFTLQTSAPTPPRMAVVAAVAGCALALASGAGVVLNQRLSREVQRLRGERVALESRCVDLDRVREENQRTDAQLELVRTEAERLAQTRRLGAPLEAALATMLDEVDSRVELRSLAFERMGAAGQARFSALCDPDPLATTRALKGLEAALEASRLFERVGIQPPTLRLGSRTDDGLEFSGECAWEAQP